MPSTAGTTPAPVRNSVCNSRTSKSGGKTPASSSRSTLRVVFLSMRRVSYRQGPGLSTAARGSSRLRRVPLRSPRHQRQQRRGGPSHADLHVSRVSAGVSAAARRPQGGDREGRGGGHGEEVGREHPPELAALSRYVHLRPPSAAGERTRLRRRARR